MSSDPAVRRLYKSRTDRMVDGICGGVAEYFGVDSTLVRIAWVLLTLIGGAGILLYLLAMIIMPTNPSVTGDVTPHPASRDRNSRFWGILLVVVGSFWFLGNLGLPIWHHWWGMAWDMALPVMLILAGVAFLFGGRNYVAATRTEGPAEGAMEALPSSAQVRRRMYKSRTEKKLFGVCGGIAAYVETDPTLVRLLFVIAAFASFGAMLLLYVIMAIIMPRQPPEVAPT